LSFVKVGLGGRLGHTTIMTRKARGHQPFASAVHWLNASFPRSP
jgi:hypothetical protein